MAVIVGKVDAPRVDAVVFEQLAHSARRSFGDLAAFHDEGRCQRQLRVVQTDPRRVLGVHRHQPVPVVLEERLPEQDAFSLFPVYLFMQILRVLYLARD